MFELYALPDQELLEKLRIRHPDLDVSALSSFLKLMRTSADVLGSLEAFLTRHGLSQRRFFVLILLTRNPGGLKVSDLASGTGVSGATMTGVLDTMEKAGLVARTPSPEDRRSILVHCTPKGRGLLESLLPEHYRRINRIMGNLSDEDRHTLLGLLERIDDGMKGIN